MLTVLKSGSLKLLEPSGPVQACNGIALPLPLPITVIFQEIPLDQPVQICKKYSDPQRLNETHIQTITFIPSKTTFVLILEYNDTAGFHSFH